MEGKRRTLIIIIFNVFTLVSILFSYVEDRLNLRTIEINGTKVVTYNLEPYGQGLGASARLDIKKALEDKYGPEDTVIEVYTGEWNGRDVMITDKVRLMDIDYLGQEFKVGRYVKCGAVIDRNAYDLNTKEFISTASRIVKYKGFDDTTPMNEERAHLLEDTLEEKYIGNIRLFQISE